MVYYYLSGVLLLVNYYFQISFNLKVVLHAANITENSVTELI